MRAVLRFLAKFVIATLAVAAVLIAFAVFAAHRFRGHTDSWIAATLIVGGALSLTVAGLGAFAPSPAYWGADRRNTLSSGLPGVLQKSYPALVALLVSLGLVGLGVLAHFVL